MAIPVPYTHLSLILITLHINNEIEVSVNRFQLLVFEIHFATSLESLYANQLQKYLKKKYSTYFVAYRYRDHK